MHAPGGIAMGRTATGCEAEHNFGDLTAEDCETSNCHVCQGRPQQVFYHPQALDVDRAHGVCCNCFQRMLEIIRLCMGSLQNRMAGSNIADVCPLCRTAVNAEDLMHMKEVCGLMNHQHGAPQGAERGCAQRHGLLSRSL